MDENAPNTPKNTIYNIHNKIKYKIHTPQLRNNDNINNDNINKDNIFIKWTISIYKINKMKKITTFQKHKHTRSLQIYQ